LASLVQLVTVMREFNVKHAGDKPVTPRKGRNMKIARVALYAVLALALIGMIPAAATADIVHVETFLLDGPISGGTSAELAFVLAETGFSGDLGVFGKWNAGAGNTPPADCSEDCVAEANKLEATGGATKWTLEWDGLINWSLEFILVKDGVEDGKHLYSLFMVTDAQANSGSGDIWLKTESCPTGTEGGGACKGISHFTVFGVEGTSVPEPTTVLLLGLGLVGLGVAARKKIGS
jgi:hypothetical protein